MINKDPMPHVPEKWPVWSERCGHCGTEGNGLRILECPNCSRDGCPECMPGGVNCSCPECETDEVAE